MKGLLTFLLLSAFVWQASAQDLSKRLQKKKDAFEAQISAEEKYIELLSEAEYAFEHGNFAKARRKYEEAKAYNPAKEQWLIAKINDLDILMAEGLVQLIDTVPQTESLQISQIEGQAEVPKIEEELRSLPLPANPDENPGEPTKLDPSDKKIAEPKKNEEISLKEDPIPLKSDVVFPKPKSADELLKEKVDYSAYPFGVTEENIDMGSHKIQRIVVNDSVEINVYKRVRHNWGGDYTFKNNESISKRIWLNEVQQARYKQSQQQ